MYKSYLKSIKPSRKVLFSISSSVFVDYSTSMITNESTIAAGGTELGPRGRLIVKLCFISHSILPINQNHSYFLPFKCINKGVLLQTYRKQTFTKEGEPANQEELIHYPTQLAKQRTHFISSWWSRNSRKYTRKQ